ncbi:MAG TPA: Gfo/Idh/MocA family oxidoreductase [Thermoleophilaceae bacterium]|nr:Gfo/Idh/MocA family oxidoreductase [Thermoleophilaceae bacterium]
MIGCGYWGANYVRVLNELPGVQLMAACDQREDRLGEVARRSPQTDVVTDFDSVIERTDVEAVLLCTQAGTHYELGLRCLEAGKHILIEKPLTTRSEHALRLMRLAEAKGLTLMVGHTFLYNPAVETVKEYVSDPASGPVYYLYARRTNLGPIRPDVNAIWDLAPHDVSIFNFLLGRNPLWVSAAGGRPLGTAREDVGFATLGYGGDMLGHIHVSWADPNKTREVVVVCQEKRIVFNDLDSMERVRVFEKGVQRHLLDSETTVEPQFALREGRIVSPPVPSTEPLRRQLEHFVECVRTGARPLSDAHAGLAVVQVMEAMSASVELSGSPVVVGSGEQAMGGERVADSIR